MDNSGTISYSIKGAADASGMSCAAIYRLLRAGKIEAFKLNKRTLVKAESLRRFMNDLPAATFRPPSNTAA